MTQERVEGIKRKIEMITKERGYVQQAIQTQILYDMASLLEDMGKTLVDFHQDWKETIPKAKLRPLELTITQNITRLDPTNTYDMPWMTFDLSNDGPDPVYVTINEEELIEKAPLNSGDSLTVDMKKRNIRKLYLFCGQGNTAQVRIYAKS